MIRLPVDAVVPEVLEHMGRGRNVVLEAPPGAGKTTRVPSALLGREGSVVVLEPRRLAVRLAARRVASERGEKLGDTVGYQVRFEEVAGPRTRLRFVTEGVLTRRLLSDRELRGVTTVVLDEFHERHLDTDLALALLRRLQRSSRPDLRLIVMSATLEAGPVARFLDAAVVKSEGRLFDISIRHTPYSAAPVEEQVATALDSLLAEGLDGDVLVFLPGAAEIRRCARTVEAAARRADLLVVPLHGDLSPEEQDRAVLPASRRKVILSTNVAESSVTIEGVTAVIDSGLARVAVDSPWTGLATLDIGRISKASARQRAGRAGRTAPGRVIRLYSLDDFQRRPDHDSPEVQRRELSPVYLELAAMGVSGLEWLEPPPAAAASAATELLNKLGAVNPSGAITPLGRKMADLPLHPRLARLVVEAEQRGAGDGGCAAAAVLSAGERLPDTPGHEGPSDLFVLMESQWQPSTRRVYDQLRRQVRGGRQRGHDEAILLATLAAFPDRLAKRRQGDDLILAAGGSAQLARSSVVRKARFLVAVDVESRRDRSAPLVRLASEVQPEWLIDLFPDRIVERKGVEWNRQGERVDAVSGLEYEGIAIEESSGGVPDPEQAAALLAQKALDTDLGRFVDREGLDLLLARIAFASERAGLPPLTMEGVAAILRELCLGRRSFADLEKADLLGAIAAHCSGYRLHELAPEKVTLKTGRQARIHYASGQIPWVASRLQDFVGMRETPKIGGVPLVVHLLAPNHRPVQMTQDLAGFWDRLYPEIKKQLSRRYPKHHWP